MNYKKIHDDLIISCLVDSPITRIKRRNSNDYRLHGGTLIYTERHHIIPKGAGGTNVASNMLVVLPEEHLMLHQLRCKIYHTRCDIRAVHFMSSHFIKSQLGKNKLKQYSWCRQQYSETCSGENHPMFGKTHTDDTKKKLSDFRKGKLYAKHTATGEYVGLVSNKHPDIISGKWSHISKGILSPNKGRDMREHRNVNWSGYSDEEIITHAIIHYKTIGFWSRKLWMVYCDLITPPLPKHYQQHCRFSGMVGTGTQRFYAVLEKALGTKIIKKRR